MSGRVERAEALVADLVDAGIPATIDPAAVAGLAPCVLVTPPRLQLQGARFTTWRLTAIAATTTPGLEAWRQLDQLLDQLDAELPLTAAEPASFTLSAGADPAPAYLVTYEEAS